MNVMKKLLLSAVVFVGLVANVQANRVSFTIQNNSGSSQTMNLNIIKADGSQFNQNLPTLANGAQVTSNTTSNSSSYQGSVTLANGTVVAVGGPMTTSPDVYQLQWNSIIGQYTLSKE